MALLRVGLYLVFGDLSKLLADINGVDRDYGMDF